MSVALGQCQQRDRCISAFALGFVPAMEYEVVQDIQIEGKEKQLQKQQVKQLGFAVDVSDSKHVQWKLVNASDTTFKCARGQSLEEFEQLMASPHKSEAAEHCLLQSHVFHPQKRCLQRLRKRYLGERAVTSPHSLATSFQQSLSLKPRFTFTVFSRRGVSFPFLMLQNTINFLLSLS